MEINASARHKKRVTLKWLKMKKKNTHTQNKLGYTNKWHNLCDQLKTIDTRKYE